MQVPIIGGIYTDSSSDFRISYPVNLKPTPMDSGMSTAYLRPIDGLKKIANGTGTDRGGINWNGVLYRVMGTSLVSIDPSGIVVTIGSVGAGGPCTFDYSFDRLAVTSGGRLYYYDGATLTQVTDPDLGVALDVIWIDGYFMTTDGTYLVTTDISNPLSVSPVKYGSSEIDPDPINSVMKLRNEVYAVNRYTIEVFQNVGGSGFPFQRINGAQVQRGSVGTYASAIFSDTIAFVGSGRNEATGVYLAEKSKTQKISTKEIDTILASYSDQELAAIRMDVKADKGNTSLWIHLPDRVLVYDMETSMAFGAMVWHIMTGGISGFSQYPGIGLVWAYNRWNVGGSFGNEIGYLDTTNTRQWGDVARWEFSTSILYNEGYGAIVHEVELVALTGDIELGLDPQISTSYSKDGRTWSMPKYIHAGKIGQRNKRLVWYQQGTVSNRRIQSFSGDSTAFISIVRLDIKLEPLSV